MARFFRGAKLTRLALIGATSSDYDKPNINTSYDDDEMIAGWEGIRRIFVLDRHGDPSETLMGMFDACLSGCILSGLIGAGIHSRLTFFNFLENNEATKFMNQYDAKRKLQDNVFHGACKGALRYAIKYGSFCSVYIITTTLIGTYMGGFGFTEFLIGGCITGALYKMNMGLKGVIAGAFVGTAIGSAFGLCNSILILLGGKTIREVYKAQKEFKMLRHTVAQENLTKDIGEEFGTEHSNFLKTLSTLEEPKK